MHLVFFHNHNYQGDIGKFIYKASIIGNKQLLTNMIDCKATQVPCDGIALITKLIKTIVTALKLYNTRGDIYTSTKRMI